MSDNTVILTQVCDFEDPETGKTYRQLNAEKVHNIPLGALVEVNIENDDHLPPKNGLRLFVVSHDRDCDETPLYSLSFNKDWKEEPSPLIPRIAYRMQIDSGYSEECLTVIDDFND